MDTLKSPRAVRSSASLLARPETSSRKASWAAGSAYAAHLRPPMLLPRAESRRTFCWRLASTQVPPACTSECCCCCCPCDASSSNNVSGCLVSSPPHEESTALVSSGAVTTSSMARVAFTPPTKTAESSRRRSRRSLHSAVTRLKRSDKSLVARISSFLASSRDSFAICWTSTRNRPQISSKSTALGSLSTLGPTLLRCTSADAFSTGPSAGLDMGACPSVAGITMEA
mmetsp:Transcript_18386/g.52690  ORF Transcript_18386/g.52690 Transcript_18386/m.52690 type:complete len:228 (-) Transcript_18386:339-1022(-)